MTEIIKGQKTKVFQNYPVPQREVCKISIYSEFVNDCYIVTVYKWV